MGWEPYKALYVHVPFCKRRCRYCDFDTDAVAADDPAIDAYFDDLVLKVRRAAKAGELSQVRTVFIGGGTPTHAGVARLDELMQTLAVSMHMDDVEVTVEANPESLTEPMVRDLWALGVNRLSIGVQSLDDDVLRALGRVHDAEGAKRAIDTAHERFENVSVDMMCGIPGQTGEGFCDDLRQVCALGVTHVSVYPLTIEEGTPLAAMVERGEFPDVNQDTQAMFMQMAAHALEPLGLKRYEVASYARPGFQCEHNKAYWTGVPYLGIGRSAVTMKQDERHRVRVRDGVVEDDLDRCEMAAEDAMLGMRMTQGLSDEQVREMSLLLPRLLMTLDDLMHKRLLVHEDGRWKPTLGGWLCGNDLYEPLYALAP